MLHQFLHLRFSILGLGMHFLSTTDTYSNAFTFNMLIKLNYSTIKNIKNICFILVKMITV